MIPWLPRALEAHLNHGRHDSWRPFKKWQVLFLKEYIRTPELKRNWFDGPTLSMFPTLRDVWPHFISSDGDFWVVSVNMCINKTLFLTLPIIGNDHAKLVVQLT